MTLKISVIGTGAMRKNHTRACDELENVKLVFIAYKDTVKNIAKRFDVLGFFNYKYLLKKVDAVIIATHTITHFDIAFDAINNVKHILIEKTVRDTVKKGKELISKATEAAVAFAVDHIKRQKPADSFVKQAIDNGQFGELITLGLKRVSNFPG